MSERSGEQGGRRSADPVRPSAPGTAEAGPVVFWEGRQVLLAQYGPVNLRIQARVGGVTDREAAHEAASAGLEALRELAPYRAVLSAPAWTVTPEPSWPRVLRLMVGSAAATGDPTLTPLAAVAGSIAQVALEAGTRAGARTVVVDNGGDVALAVEPGETVGVGIARSIDDRRLTHRILVDAASGICGVCTSGLGGRSLTRGIAEIAVAVSRHSSLADACATVLGNATLVTHPAIEQARAAVVDPTTDIPELWVTTRVGPLPDALVDQALLQARAEAVRLMEMGLLLGAFVSVQGRHVLVPPSVARPV